ncbi:MAG: fused MFS/spermidine synthase [Xanthomarina sp.]
MRRLISYLYPITKKIESDINGTLEITWYNGKKHLNTKNANYSYGSLQQILKFGLEKIDLSKVQSVLLLGLGGGSVIETLRKDFNYQKNITAIDIDPVIIRISKDEFCIEENESLEIICTDAFEYIQKCQTTFDLIIIDLFIDIKVPEKFLNLPFWDLLLKRKTTNGVILFNASLEDNLSIHLETIIDYLKSHVYKIEVFDKVLDTNRIILTSSI